MKILNNNSSVDQCLRLQTRHSLNIISLKAKKLLLVIVLTKAAPALVIKWSGEYFLK